MVMILTNHDVPLSAMECTFPLAYSACASHVPVEFGYLIPVVRRIQVS